MRAEEVQGLMEAYSKVYETPEVLNEEVEELDEATPQVVSRATTLNKQTTTPRSGESASVAKSRGGALEYTRRGGIVGQTVRTLTRGFGSAKDIARVDAEDKASQARINQRVAASQGKYYSSSDGKTYKNYNDALAARNSRLAKTKADKDNKPDNKPDKKPDPSLTAAPKPAAPSGGMAKVAPKPSVPTPGTKAAGPESIKPKTPNPLLKDNKISDMIDASKQRQAGSNVTSTDVASNRASAFQAASSALSGSGVLASKPQASSPMMAKTAPSTSQPVNKSTGSKKPGSIVSSYNWNSSKVIDDIKNAYQSVYEAKKKDQDGDKDEDFADVMIARMIASGMSRAEAIAAVKNKEYNEEYELDEATRMRKELGKEGETRVRGELAARSRAHQRSGSVDKTIAAAEREADRTTFRKRDESEGDYNQRMQKRSRTLRRLAAARRGSVRGEGGLRGYAAKVTGSDKDLQSARGSARSAGTLTPAEKQKLGEDFEIWVNNLLDEGYDLSNYSWEDVYEIYEETLQQKKEREDRQNERRARVAELTAQGRVMTSSKRTSQKTAQRKASQKEDQLQKKGDEIIRQITGASGRVSDKPMGSSGPKRKEEAPEPTRRLRTHLRRDTLGTAADEVLKSMRTEEYEIYEIIVEHLIEEGFTDDVESATNIIANMSEEWMTSILENYLEEDYEEEYEEEYEELEEETYGFDLDQVRRIVRLSRGLEEERAPGVKPYKAGPTQAEVRADARRAERRKLESGKDKPGYGPEEKFTDWKVKATPSSKLKRKKPEGGTEEETVSQRMDREHPYKTRMTGPMAREYGSRHAAEVTRVVKGAGEPQAVTYPRKKGKPSTEIVRRSSKG